METPHQLLEGGRGKARRHGPTEHDERFRVCTPDDLLDAAVDLGDGHGRAGENEPVLPTGAGHPHGKVLAGHAGDGTPSATSRSRSSWPVLPPNGNRAVASPPSRWMARATLMPPPPGVRLASSQWSLWSGVTTPTLAQTSSAGLKVTVKMVGMSQALSIGSPARVA